MHLITVFGGSQPALFKRAILQSPGFKLNPHFEEQDGIFNLPLAAASTITGSNITTTGELKALDEKELFQTNSLVINGSSYGTFTFGPVVDGDIYLPSITRTATCGGPFPQKHLERNDQLQLHAHLQPNRWLRILHPFPRKQSRFRRRYKRTVAYRFQLINLSHHRSVVSLSRV